MSEITTVSKRSQIIKLGKEGNTRSEIVRILSEQGYDISYQYVFNTLKERSIEVPKSQSTGTSKSSRIKQLHADGNTKAEIVKILKAEGMDVDYHYVFMITKYHIKK